MEINDINLENVYFSKIYNYNTNDGKFCHISYNNDNFKVKLPTSTVVNNVDTSQHRPSVLINFNNNIHHFNENLKNVIIDHVYKNSNVIFGTQKSIEAIRESYCNPHKKILVKNKYYDSLKLKLLVKKDDLSRFSKAQFTIVISGLWFSKDSFGPYYDISDYSVIELPKIKKSLFVEDSSDESEEINI